MKQYKAYLFDLDGTLTDTAEMIYRCFVQSCRKFGGMDISRELVFGHIGLPLRKQFEAYLGSLSDERAEEIMRSHMSYQLSIYKDFLKIFPGVAEGLEMLKRKGRLLGVVTSRRQETLSLYLKHLGIHHYFDVLVTPEMTEKHKPDPEPALKATGLLGCVSSEALFIGDAVYDIQCGSSAGMDTAFVSWSRNEASALSVKPDYIIDDLRELAMEDM